MIATMSFHVVFFFPNVKEKYECKYQDEHKSQHLYKSAILSLQL